MAVHDQVEVGGSARSSAPRPGDSPVPPPLVPRKCSLTHTSRPSLRGSLGFSQGLQVQCSKFKAEVESSIPSTAPSSKRVLVSARLAMRHGVKSVSAILRNLRHSVDLPRGPEA